MAASRDAALDAVRGWCIVSMATAHLAVGSAWWSAMHWAGWIDGAIGFVLISGLVVGITQRRAVRAGGLPAAYRSSGGRLILLWVLHIELCLCAIAVTSADVSQSGRLPSVAAEGGWPETISRVLTLRINPPTASILGLYVVIGLIGMGVVALLHAGRPLVAVAGSLLIYACAWRYPGATTFPERAFAPGYVNWAAWQALFVCALLVGWYWDSAMMLRIRRSGWWWAACGAVSLALAVIGHAVVHRGAIAGSRLGDVLDVLFGDGRLGPGAIVFGFAAVLALYRAAGALHRRGRAGVLLWPLTRLGRRSLDSYVIIAVASLVAPSIGGYRPGGAQGQLLALGTLVGCLGWACVRDAAGRRSGVQDPAGRLSLALPTRR